MVKDAQVRVLRRKLMDGKTQEAAAAGAGMSVGSARKWRAGRYPSQARKRHWWRNRPDPFAEVFESEVVPLLAADEKRVLEARTILGELNRRHPDEFSVRQLRTLQRRMRQWRALNGPDKEVFFPQEHPPGREAAYDFTNCDELGVTICGAPFDHLLFELALSFSGWRWPTVALSESYEALLLGSTGGAVAAGRRGGSVALRQSVGGDPRTGAERRAGPHPALSRAAGPLRAEVDPDLPAQSSRERGGRAGASAHQVDAGADAGAARQPRLRQRRRVPGLGARGDRARAQRIAGRQAGRGATASAPAADSRIARVYHVHSYGPPLEHDPGG